MVDRGSPAPLVALVVGPTAGYAAGPGLDESWPRAQTADRVADLTRRIEPRWVVWSAGAALREVIAAGGTINRSWDLAEVHRIVNGGWRATPGHVWAACHGLAEADVSAGRGVRRTGFEVDLLDLVPSDDDDELVRADGHLRADATGWAESPRRLALLAHAALDCQAAQENSLREVGAANAQRMIRTAWSESAAAVLCLELERDGLPIDRATAEDLVRASAGRRPRDDEEAARIRADRDRQVLRHAPGREHTDLRNPAQVRDLLLSVGVNVPTTRAWMLEPYRATHALVDALLSWRKDERIATTYGYRWLDEHVGPDDRLRGGWTTCDGAAGRMTARNGLHNLPAPLRPAVRAVEGHVFVRADLGQIEPRVLAVVSGDRAFAEATRADDLYAPVAATLGVERATAKVAVLAAMYGQRSGAAGQALRDLERAYPVAMSLLDRAYATGVGRGELRTWGGRLIRLGTQPSGIPESWAEPSSPGNDGGRGRYARNAIIQGAAAELFKAWAATVRHAVAPVDGQIVLCLHDELLLHVPEPRAAAVAQAVGRALESAARTWAGTDEVRFVADTTVVRRWSDAKG